MTRAYEAVDVSGLPEVARLAEEVRQSRTPRVLRRGNEVIATIVPVEPLDATLLARRGDRASEGKTRGAPRPPASGVVAATAGIFKSSTPSLSAEELRVAAEEAIAEDVEERSR